MTNSRAAHAEGCAERVTRDAAAFHDNTGSAAVGRRALTGSALPVVQLSPLPPLRIPIKRGRDRQELAQANGVAAVLGARQEEDLLLDVGGELQEVHDLADAGPRHPPQPGQLAAARYG